MTGTRNRRRLLPVLFLDGGLYDHLANASQYGPGQATELVPAHCRQAAMPTDPMPQGQPCPAPPCWVPNFFTAPELRFLRGLG